LSTYKTMIKYSFPLSLTEDIHTSEVLMWAKVIE